VSGPILQVPPLEWDEEPWPSLGGEVCDFIEDLLVHGPGDVLGKPAELTDEVRRFIWRAYEIFPKGHPREGRRRFKRVVLSRRKGWAKTEVAAWIAIVEMDPAGTVRCDGFRREGKVWVPVGRPVYDPYIPMVAVTEGQTEDLAYAAVFEILEHCDLGNDYDVGYERIMHKRAPGKIQALASAPSAREGARTTFEHFDETHLFDKIRLRKTHETMMRNLPKRRAADPWGLKTTTMYAPGEGSVAEDDHREAEEALENRKTSTTLLFDHRQAAERHKIETTRGLRQAIREASGDAWAWTDLEAIEDEFRRPGGQENESRRYWLNQPRKSSTKYLDVQLWDKLAKPERKVGPKRKVVLFFDGSYNRDSTALIGATVEPEPHVFVVKTWERPFNDPSWRTPRLDVMAEVQEAMSRYTVVELAPDPPGWHDEVETWEEIYTDTVVRFETNQWKRFGPACDDFYQAVTDGRLSHDGSEVLRRHLGNCVPAKRGGWTVVTKSHADSPDKIDAAVGAIGASARALWHVRNRPKRAVALVLGGEEEE
jgi:hypothetical protein